jgi:hypothetical protein
MTRTGDRGTPENLNLCKAGSQLPNTCILLDNKCYKFLPGEKAWKSTSRKMLSVTLCHVLSTAFGRSFWEYCFRTSTRHRLVHRRHCLETGNIIISFSSNALHLVLLHTYGISFLVTPSTAALSHRNLHSLGYPVTTAMLRSAIKQTRCTLFISNMTPHTVNCRSVPFLAAMKLVKFS